jgi:hypothetical protein
MLNQAMIYGKYALIALASVRAGIDTFTAGKWAYSKAKTTHVYTEAVPEPTVVGVPQPTA